MHKRKCTHACMHGCMHGSACMHGGCRDEGLHHHRPGTCVVKHRVELADWLLPCVHSRGMSATQWPGALSPPITITHLVPHPSVGLLGDRAGLVGDATHDLHGPDADSSDRQHHRTDDSCVGRRTSAAGVSGGAHEQAIQSWLDAQATAMRSAAPSC